MWAMLASLTAEQAERCAIVYEPLWTQRKSDAGNPKAGLICERLFCVQTSRRNTFLLADQQHIAYCLAHSTSFTSALYVGGRLLETTHR